MLANVILLSGYTFGCHSWRHLVGGGLDCYSKAKLGQARYRAWQWVTVLNQRHPLWAWCSMFSVVITDVYIHLLRAGIIIDPHRLLMAASPEPYDTIECDVLVVGAGGAGMRAAIAAAEAGCTVTVVTKSLLGKAHTVMAEGGIAAGIGNVDPEDSWEVHFADTMLGGQLINNWRMVELYAHEVIDRVLELERWGGIFDRTEDGRIMQRAFGAHSWKRLAHVGDRTGLELIRTCQDRMVHTPGVDVRMEYTLSTLLKSGDRVTGAFGYDRNTGRFVAFKAGAVVLASGGWGRMYRFTSNSWECSGDGAAMAYQAGPTCSTWSSCSSTRPA